MTSNRSIFDLFRNPVYLCVLICFIALQISVKEASALGRDLNTLSDEKIMGPTESVGDPVNTSVEPPKTANPSSNQLSKGSENEPTPGTDVKKNESTNDSPDLPAPTQLQKTNNPDTNNPNNQEITDSPAKAETPTKSVRGFAVNCSKEAAQSYQEFREIVREVKSINDEYNKTNKSEIKPQAQAAVEDMNNNVRVIVNGLVGFYTNCVDENVKTQIENVFSDNRYFFTGILELEHDRENGYVSNQVYDERLYEIIEQDVGKNLNPNTPVNKGGFEERLSAICQKVKKQRDKTLALGAYLTIARDWLVTIASLVSLFLTSIMLLRKDKREETDAKQKQTDKLILEPSEENFRQGDFSNLKNNDKRRCGGA
jgi:hypothetical protein